MKKLFKKSRYIVMSLVMLFVLFAGGNQASAVWQYTPVHDVVYIVSATNVAPSCNAGIDRSITLPTNSLTIPVGGATVSDSDGTVASMSWTKILGGTASITNGTTLTPTFSSLAQGSYTFRLSATDNLGAVCSDDMIVTVNAAGNTPPIVNAGSDQSITLPSSSVSVFGSASDPGGSVASTLWSKISGPATYSITSPSSLSTSITGMSTAGTYVFRLTATDNLGLTAFDDMQVVVNSAPSVTGSLTVSPNSCTIALGASTCTVTGATWNTSGTSSPNLLDANTGTTLSTLANNAFPLQVWVAYPFTTFNLRNGLTVLDSEVVTANCGVNTWNGSTCVSPVVNGVCLGSHFMCASGSSTNNNTGASSWTWNCAGSGGGSTASCSEPFPIGDPECSDGIDNDSDGLIDFEGKFPDPGCSSADDTSEQNLIKIDVHEN